MPSRLQAWEEIEAVAHAFQGKGTGMPSRAKAQACLRVLGAQAQFLQLLMLTCTQASKAMRAT
eukprot:1158039-Pelagomonas_calceolata.AAC.10